MRKGIAHRYRRLLKLERDFVSWANFSRSKGGGLLKEGASSLRVLRRYHYIECGSVCPLALNHQLFVTLGKGFDIPEKKECFQTLTRGFTPILD